MATFSKIVHKYCCVFISAADASFDDGSSIIGEGSHKSLAGTSITSTADLSILSSVTRSQAADAHSIDIGTVESDDGQTPSGLTTPLAITCASPSPDVVRIFVPYVTPSHSPIHASPQNGDLVYRQENKIRIRIVEQTTSDEIQTPVIETCSLLSLRPSQNIDLK